MSAPSAATLPATPASLDFEPAGTTLLASGDWTVDGIGGLHARLRASPWPTATELTLDFSRVTRFDTAGAWLLHALISERAAQGSTLQLSGMPPAHSALLELVRARSLKRITARPTQDHTLLHEVGWHAWHWWQEMRGMLHFVGENAVVLLRALRRPRHLRFGLILSNIEQAGFHALPIVGLLSFLIGMVIAYQSALQLQRYGGNIFIVDLVGISMLRELAPMLVAIIVAGRSGSAYAAQIGTMKVTEEVDALRTMGISPHELLVLPKLIGLMITVPLLTVYADVCGVLGGMLVANAQLQVDAHSFIDRFDDAIKVTTFTFGVSKAPVFGAIVALVGCYQGFQARGSADSVGRQTTISVVQSIFLVIIADAIFSLGASARP